MTRQLIMFRSRLTDALEGRVEHGATAVEYGLMVALIAAVIVAAVLLLGQNLDTLFNGVATLVGNHNTVPAG